MVFSGRPALIALLLCLAVVYYVVNYERRLSTKRRRAVVQQPHEDNEQLAAPSGPGRQVDAAAPPPVQVGWTTDAIGVPERKEAEAPTYEVDNGGGGDDGAVRVLRGVRLPPARPSDRMLEVGTSWHRYGKPFHNVRLRTLCFVFQCQPGPRGQLVAFAQRLEGIFDPSRRQYLLLWVHEMGDLVALLKMEGEEIKRTTLEGTFCDGKHKIVTLKVVKPTRILLTAHSVAESPMGDFEGHAERALAERLDQLGNVTVDSGLYLGAVPDQSYLRDHDGIPALDSLHGRLHSQILVNGVRSTYMGSSSTTSSSKALDRGTTLEAAGESLSRAITNLSGPVDVGNTINQAPVDLHNITVKQFPVLSALSDSHYREIAGLIQSVHKTMPRRGILIYDLGLIERYVKKLRALQRVAVRKFPAELYPDLVQDLYQYRFKPMLIHSGLQTFGGVIYADSSIRFQLPVLQIPQLKYSPGVMLFAPDSISPLHAYTHGGMLKYLGLSRADVTNGTVVMGGLGVWVDKPFTVDVLLPLWLRCVLDKSCIAPPGAKLMPCDQVVSSSPVPLTSAAVGRYLGCHRYDQSALSCFLLKISRTQKADMSDIIVPDSVVSKFVEVKRM